MNFSLDNSTVNESDLEKEFVLRREAADLAFRIYLELFTILSLICTAVNVLICFVIVRYRRLRQEKSNIILLHWAIVNSLFMLSTPTTTRFIFDFSHLIGRYITVYCVVEQLEHTLLLADIFLITFLMMYWYLRLYYPSKFQKVVDNFIFYLASLYVICAISVAVDIHSCHNNIHSLAHITLFMSYLLFFIFMIIINIMHVIKKRKLENGFNGNYIPFILSNTFFVSYLPTLLALVLGLFIEFGYTIIMNIVYVTFFISTLTPVYFFLILFKFDNDFNTFFRHVLTCKCREYDEEFQEQQVVYNNGVNERENKC